VRSGLRQTRRARTGGVLEGQATIETLANRALIVMAVAFDCAVTHRHGSRFRWLRHFGAGGASFGLPIGGGVLPYNARITGEPCEKPPWSMPRRSAHEIPDCRLPLWPVMFALRQFVDVGAGVAQRDQHAPSGSRTGRGSRSSSQ